MQERDPFPLRTDTWRLVDQPDTRGAAAIHHFVEILNGEADVMHSGPTFFDETGNWIVTRVRLEQLYKRFSGLKTGDARAVRVVERHLGHSEDVAVEIDAFVNGPNSDSYMGNTGSAGAWWVH